MTDALSDQDVARIGELERDVDYMVDRMDGRLQKYSDFAASLESIAKKIGEITRPDPGDVGGYFEEASTLLRPGPLSPESRQRLIDLTERARLVAQAQEDTMKEKKVLAVQALLAFEALRGARNWDETIRRGEFGQRILIAEPKRGGGPSVARRRCRRASPTQAIKAGAPSDLFGSSLDFQPPDG